MMEFEQSMLFSCGIGVLLITLDVVSSMLIGLNLYLLLPYREISGLQYSLCVALTLMFIVVLASIINAVLLYLKIILLGGQRLNSLESGVLAAALPSALIIGVIGVVGSLVLVGVCHKWRGEGAVGNSLTEAFGAYPSGKVSKPLVDKLQIDYKCCGIVSYKDWFNSSWYPGTSRDHVPFSCCSNSTALPCVHHYLNTPSKYYRSDIPLTIWKRGCAEPFYDSVSTTLNHALIASISLSIVQVAFAILDRYLKNVYLQIEVRAEDTVKFLQTALLTTEPEHYSGKAHYY